MSAIERIELSRARLRLAMQPPPPAPAHAATGPLAWLERLKEQPSIAIIIDALQNWWSRHPIRPVVQLATEATNAVARPIAAHNPFALVAVAALVGVIFAWSRPWRWALKPALFAGLLPQLVSRAVSHLPVDSWLAAFTAPAPGPRPPTESPRTAP